MKAMVLAAGHGTRLGHLTREMPKPMLPLDGKPMLAYILAHLRNQGFDEVAINLHFRPEAIREYFGDGSAHGIKIVYSEEPHLLGTAGGVKKMENFLRGPEPFLIQYGDVVTDQDFGALLHFHRERKSLATLLLHQRAKSNSIVSLGSDGQIIGFLERPDEETRRGVVSPWVNSGICLCEPEFLDAIPPSVACDLPRDVYSRLVSGGRLFGFPLSGYRCAVDSPERYREAEGALAGGRCRSKLASA
jgi:NDP-sugar pyrophosphorylase family protein